MSMLLILVLMFFQSSEMVKIDVLPKIDNFLKRGNTGCVRESILYREALKNYSTWAHKMLDSSAKGSFGVLRGNNYQLGDYNQCLSVNGLFSTQYCLVRLTMDVPILRDVEETPSSLVYTKLQKAKHFRQQRSDTVFYGLCLPASCSAADIQNSSLKLVNVPNEKRTSLEDAKYKIVATDRLCVSKKKPARQIGPAEIGFCVCTGLLILLAMLSTLKKCVQRHDNGGIGTSVMDKMIWSFSVQTNWRKLFRDHEDCDQTKVFNSVRVISVSLVVFGHSAVYTSEQPLLIGEAINKLSLSQFGYLLEQVNLVVNTFFVVSGLLLSYGVLKKLKNTSINPFTLLVLRYLRLTPLNAYVTFYYATILKFSGSGPVWNLLGAHHSENCQNYWWLNLLYLNNFFIELFEICNLSTWFISCNFQLFLLGILIMFAFKKNWHLGTTFLTTFLVISIGTPMILTEVYKLTPVMGIKQDENSINYFKIFYEKPYTQGSSYLIGLIGGIVYHKLINRKTKIAALRCYTILAFSMFLMTVSLGYLSVFFKGQENFPLEMALYNSFHRLFWSIGVLGIFVVASFGPLTMLKAFLCASFWTPLARLSYGVYLVHLVVLIPNFASRVTPLRPTPLNVVQVNVFYIFCSYAISFLLFIFVEAPFANIFREMFCGWKTKKNS